MRICSAATLLETGGEIMDPVAAVQAGLEAHLETRGYKRDDTARYTTAAARVAMRRQRISDQQAACTAADQDKVDDWTRQSGADARHATNVAAATLTGDIPVGHNVDSRSDSEGICTPTPTESIAAHAPSG